MRREINTNHSLNDYKKKYRNSRFRLLSFTKQEVENYDKSKKTLEKNFLLKGRSWWFTKEDNTYHEIPKAPRWTWFRNLNTTVKACSYCLVAGGLIGAGYGIYSYLNRPSPYQSDIKNVESFNNILSNEKAGFTYPKKAVDYLKDNGVSIDTLEPVSSDVEYGYNLSNNEIVLIGKADEQIKYSKTKVNKTSDVWRFKDKYTPSVTSFDKTYGTYLKPNSSSKISNNSEEDSVNSNLDVGENKNCNLVFNGSVNNEVPIIVTNYGSLVINGSLDSISHYGILNTLTVKSIEGQYNEYGTVYGDVIVEDGTFNAQKASDINTIILASPKVQVKVSVDNTNVGSIAATDTSYITETSVVVPQEKKQQPKIIEDKSIDPTKKEFEGLGTEASPYMITNINQTTKITKKYEEDDSYACYIYAGSETTIDAKEWTYTNGKSMHLHGQFDCNGLTINNMDSYFVNKLGKVGDYANQKLNKISNLTVNATIARPDACAPIARTAGEYVLLENITVHGYIAAGGASSFVAYGANNLDDVAKDMYLTFKNCYSDASLYVTVIGQGGLSPYFVHANCNRATGLTTYEDTIFEGKMIYPDFYKNTNTSYCRYFNSTAQRCLKVKTVYSDEFIKKYGDPEGVLYAKPAEKESDGSFYAGTDPWTDSRSRCLCYDDFKKTEVISTLKCSDVVKISQATDSSAEQLKSVSSKKVEKADYAIASLYIAPNDQQGKGSYLGCYLNEEIDLSNLAVGQEFSTTDVKNYRIRVNRDNVTEQGRHDYQYDVYDNHEFYYYPEGSGETLVQDEYSSAHISIVQYDSNNLPLSINTFKLIKPAS